MASADYINQEIKGLKKSFDNGSQLMIQQFMNIPVFNVQVTDQFTELFTSTEGLSGVRELSEQETPDTLKLQDGRPVTLVANRFGGAIEVTTTDMVKMKDGSIKVDTYMTRQRDRLLKANNQKMAVDLHRFFNEAFDSGSNFLAPDGVELCGAHTWSSGAAWDNSDTQILDTGAVDTAEEYAGAFLDSEGDQMPLNFDTIVVKKGSAAERQAIKLFAENIVPDQVANINIYEGSYKIVATPYITSANTTNWFMFDSNIDDASPLYLGINKVPSLSDGIVQNNGNVRTNSEMFYKQGINNMPFAIYGSNGTT